MTANSDCPKRLDTRPKLHIRSASNAEFATLLDLQAASLRGIGHDRYTSAQIESLVKGQQIERDRRNEVILLAEREGEIAGFVALDPHRPRLSGIYVRPAHARQGIGTMLLDAAEASVRKRHSRVMVVLSSLTAVEFYRERGYRYIAETGFYSCDRVWIPCVRFRKSLILLNSFEQWWEDWMSPLVGELA
ncbi:MAG: GNAT family N-acetyltransferase [Cyanobacteria bacterium J06648_11]